MTEIPTASPASAVEGLSTESLLDGQERWLDQKPDTYTMTLTLMCFCPHAGTWAVEVDGETATGGPLSDRMDDVDAEPPTVDLLYRWAVSLVEPADGVGARAPDATIIGFIDEHGVPLRTDIDIARSQDEELRWTIRDFQPADSGAEPRSLHPASAECRLRPELLPF